MVSFEFQPALLAEHIIDTAVSRSESGPVSVGVGVRDRMHSLSTERELPDEVSELAQQLKQWRRLCVLCRATQGQPVTIVEGILAKPHRFFVEFRTRDAVSWSGSKTPDAFRSVT